MDGGGQASHRDVPGHPTVAVHLPLPGALPRAVHLLNPLAAPLLAPAVWKCASTTLNKLLAEVTPYCRDAVHSGGYTLAKGHQPCVRSQDVLRGRPDPTRAWPDAVLVELRHEKYGGRHAQDGAEQAVATSDEEDVPDL